MKDIVLFGCGDRAKVVKFALDAAGHKIQWWCYTPQPNRDWRPDVAPASLAVVANWPLKIRPEVLALPKYGFINCHAGPVPNYRGGSPLNWQIINGEDRLWVSLLRMDEGLDTGPVLSQTSFRLEPHETIKEAHEKANIAFAEMVTAYVDLLENYPESITETPQSFYKDIRPTKTWPQRNDDMGMIDMEWEPERVINFIRALTHPYPGAWLPVGSYREKRRVRIWSASLETAISET